jgi:hypothetical protein
MDWLLTPEIQTDPHHWWATFGGHALSLRRVGGNGGWQG